MGAENIINWRTKRINGRDQLVLVVLRECVEEPDGYAYKDEIQYRELALKEGKFICRVWRRAGGTASGTYAVDSEYHPKPKGKEYWDEIPFTFVGAQNNDPTIDDSPLAALVEINHGHYRNSADYEDSVWFCGQVQPYMTGLDTGWRDHLEKTGVKIGSRSPLMLPKDGSFGYAQAQPNMLAKEAMDSKRDYMVQLGARLIEQNATVKTATQASGEQSASTSVLGTAKGDNPDLTAIGTAGNWKKHFTSNKSTAGVLIKLESAVGE
ncbi:major capsid protein [Enterobacter hormaechei subsp. steigerwaltii]|uniref:major capsid protein n=1 Tax=Enterobacter hormaechei TaxID=158836 RepID=UPI003F41FBED